MTSNNPQFLQQGLRTAHSSIIEAIQGVSEAEVYRVPAPGEWTVAQLLAHIAEIQDFWMSKALLITQEDNPNVTRTEVENDLRAAAVADHAQDSLPQLVRELERASASAISAVGTLDSTGLARPGHRGEGNPITAGGVVQFLVAHIQEHVGQVKESLRLIREGSR